MRLLITFVFAIIINLVVGDKWSYLKENEKKRMEKKKEYRTVEESKKEVYEKPLNKINYKKKNNKKSVLTKDETFLKDEQFQLCRSVEEDDVKNTLLKFGLVTHLYDEVSKFRKAMKSLQDLTPKSKKKKKTGPAHIAKADKVIIQQKGGSPVKVSQSNWVGRSLGINPLSSYHFGYDEGTNYIEGNKRRRKRDSYLRTMRGRKGTLKVPVGQVPLCYGWKYLKALDALIDDEHVDTEYLDQSVSDMLDMKFSQEVSSIIEECGNALLGPNMNICPSLDVVNTDQEPSCEDQCQPGGDSDCQFREICCKANCGGYQCLPIKTAKSNKCEEADQFMQCLYMKIDTQLCSGQ